MAKFNKTEDYTFAKLCSTFETFEIPNFQRPYSWTNKNLQDFWGSIIENNENYFIGNIVAVGSSPLKIIDGQQRLTTISLLLCAVRDSYKELNVSSETDKQLVDQRIEEINNYLIWKDLEIVPLKIKKRLILGKNIFQKVFEKIIDEKLSEIKVNNLGDNEKRIFNNYKILKSLVKKFIKDSELDRLEKIKNKILKLQVITIVCDSDNDIYGIFEGFNSTGLGLSVADLVKNSLLKASVGDLEKQESIESKWNELEELFEETSTAKFPKFLRYQWISENGYISMSNLYREIKSNKIEQNSDIAMYVNKLVNDGKIYVWMIYDIKRNLLDVDNEIKNKIFEFKYLRNEQVYEILLSWFKLYEKGKFKKNIFIASLKKLWFFTIRAKFVSINPSEYEKIFSNHCETIMNSDNIKEDLKIFFKKLKPLVDNKDQFVSNLLSDIKYGRDNKIIKRIYMDLMLDSNPEVVQRDPDIEHILPQSPNKWGFEKKDIRDYVNKIGNLTLLFSQYNKDIGNNIIEEKKEIFLGSSFILNKEIATKWATIFSEDYKKAIEKRGIEIAKKIEVLWSIN